MVYLYSPCGLYSFICYNIDMLKIVILGSSDMLYNVIEGVCATTSEIVGVMNWKDIRKKTLKDFFTQDFLNTYINQKQLYSIKAKSANSEEFKKELIKLNPDLMIVCTWGEKIKKEIFSIPKIATINIHPSLLPKYRGANPYSRVIMFGERKTGLTFHLMDENFDTGAILFQKEFEIFDTDNALTLKQRLASQLKNLIPEFLNKIEHEILTPIPQDEKISSYYSHVSQDEIVVEPNLMTYKEIDERVRGLAPHQSTYLLYKDEYFKIKKYSLTEKYIPQNKANITLKTKDNKLIYFENLRSLGKFKKYFSSIILNALYKNENIG